MANADTDLDRTRLRASDHIAVRSRVSWAAIIAGAMVALTIYIVLMLLGLAVGIEATKRDPNAEVGTVTGLYSIFVLALSMFFGGWATTRLAVGEDKLESVLHALILWGVLFLGLIWLVSAGIRTGFGAMLGMVSGTYTVAADTAKATTGAGGEIDVDRVAADFKKMGFEDAQVDQAVNYYRDLRTNPVETIRGAADDPQVRQAADQLQEATRRAIHWTLTGVIVSLLVTILGALVGSGDVPVPVPLGIMRRPPARPTA